MSEAPLALSAGWRVMYHNERDVDRTGPASRNAAVALDVEHERPGFLLRPAGDDLSDDEASELSTCGPKPGSRVRRQQRLWRRLPPVGSAGVEHDGEGRQD